MTSSQSSVGLAVLDEMIRETAEGANGIIDAAVKADPGFAPTWARGGAELGVGIRLQILREARSRVLTAEAKRLEVSDAS